MMIDTKEENWLWLAVQLGLAALCLMYLTGCSTETGWAVQFGVTPITEINDQQGHSKAKVIAAENTRK